MFAVIKTGGKQYIVTPGQKLKVEKLEVEAGTPVVFDHVFLIAGESAFKLGDPVIKGAVVKARAIRQLRTRKITVFKYHNKTRYRKKAGHRQHMTEVEIQDIIAQ